MGKVFSKKDKGIRPMYLWQPPEWQRELVPQLRQPVAQQLEQEQEGDVLSLDSVPPSHPLDLALSESATEDSSA